MWEIRGWPWNWNPEADVQPGDVRVRFLTEEEKVTGRPEVYEGEKYIYRMQLRREYVLQHGYTEGCPVCQSALSGTSRQGHSERRRARMEVAVRSSSPGQQRIARQVEKENQKLARKIEEADSTAAKEARTGEIRVAPGRREGEKRNPTEWITKLHSGVQSRGPTWPIDVAYVVAKNCCVRAADRPTNQSTDGLIRGGDGKQSHLAGSISPHAAADARH